MRELTVYIPDDLATRLRRLLGFETRYQLDGFLKEHGVYQSSESLAGVWKSSERTFVSLPRSQEPVPGEWKQKSK